ncbi:MAG: bifunctional 4-hydroxy-3-methylbut-2-enyl diphosphate reductase/30S ribosomal protein S1 [Fervidobacterium sp.]
MSLEIVKGPIGFCFGVKNAIDEIVKRLENGEILFTDGDIVHNNSVLEKLKMLGLKYEPQDNCRFVVRAHGLPPDKIAEISKRYEIIDLTCPIVSENFRLATKLYNDGYRVVVFGKKDHPEMIALSGYVNNAIVTAESLTLPDDKIAIISQTTSSEEDFVKFVEEMHSKNRGKEIKVLNTICKVTIEREKAVNQLAKLCNLIIVVGGKNSSNTKKLYEISSKITLTLHVENIKEFINNLNGTSLGEILKDEKIKVGLISGTSTDSNDVDKIASYLIENYGGRELYMADLNNISKEELLEDSFEQLLSEYESTNQVGRGRIVEGVVTQISPTGLTIDLGGKVTGFVPLEELFREINEYKVGDKVKARVEKIDENEGTAILSEKKPMERFVLEEIRKAKESGKAIHGKIVERIKGGYKVILENTVEAFLPGSESNIKEDEEIPKGKIQFAVLSFEIRGRKANIVVSRKKLFQKLIEEFYTNRKPGDVIEGIVEDVDERGAVIKVAGVTTGYIPNGEISYNASVKAKDVLKIGKTMKFLIKEINHEKKRLILSLKALLPDPWENVPKKYQVGQIVTGVVTSVKPFGFFAKLEDGVEGFIPIEEVFWQRKGNINEVVSSGDFVRLQVLEVNPEKRQIKLSYKSVIGDPWENLLAKMTEGSIAQGKVIKVLPKGVIIEIEPEVTAFCNISEISWNFVDKVEDVIKENEIVRFQIINIDRNNKRIHVSIRKAMPNPWENFAKIHKEGDIVRAKIIKSMEKGYIGLCENIEVYIPKSQVYENLNLGDEIDGKIIKLEQQKDIYKVIVSPKAYENSFVNQERSNDFGKANVEVKISNDSKTQRESTDGANSRQE